MWMPRTLLVDFLNAGISSSLVILALLFLRPLLRKLPAQSRTLSWYAVWLPVFYRIFASVPLRFGFQSLFVPRTEKFSDAEYIPRELAEGGTLRSILLPGGIGFSVPGTPEQIYQRTDRVFFWLTLIWLVGMLVLGWITIKRSLELDNLLDHAEPLDWRVQRDFLADYHFWRDPEIVRCKGLPTSFVRSKWSGYQICLQDELPPEQLQMVLMHETCHLKAMHCYAKGMFYVVCLLQWFNPLFWLAYRLFCKDLELACDEAVIRRLGAAHKEDYAEMLLELASAKPIWGSPTSFGECDAAVRIRFVLGGHIHGRAVRVLSTLLILCLGFWLIAPAPVRTLPGEIETTWSQFVELKAQFTVPGEFFEAEDLQNAAAIWYRGPTSEWGDGAKVATEGKDGSWKQYALYCSRSSVWENTFSFWAGGEQRASAETVLRPDDLSEWTRVPLQ